MIPQTTTQGGPFIIKDGLVFYIDPANPKSYVSGDTFCHNLKNPEIGTLSNGAMFDSLNQGSWTFNGSTENINFGDEEFGIPDGGSFTISVWFNPSVLSDINEYPAIIQKGFTILGGFEMLLDRYSTTELGKVIFVVNDRNCTSTTQCEVGKWYNVTGTQSASDSKPRIYINGVLEFTQSTTSFLNTSNPLMVGMRFGGGAWFGGKIGPTMMWNRGLGAEEILHNYNALKTRFNL